MEVSETLVLEVGGYQFLYLSSEQWIWPCSVWILCTDGVCLDEPFSLKDQKNQNGSQNWLLMLNSIRIDVLASFLGLIIF